MIEPSEVSVLVLSIRTRQAFSKLRVRGRITRDNMGQ